MRKTKRILGVMLSSVMVAGCFSGMNLSAAAGEGSLFTPGTYQATADGFEGPISVSVTVTEDAITSIGYSAQHETPTVGGLALPDLVKNVLSAQSTNIDGVTGATFTSTGFFNAVNDALTQAGADPASLVAAEVEKEPAEDMELTCDVVVAGAGGAGMTAAITAAQAGKNVIILEKAAVAGGNSSYATGGMNAAETHYQKEEGIEDSVDLFVSDTMKGGHDINNPDLVQTLAENSSAAIDWLDSIGAPLSNIGQAGGASTKRQHRPVNEEGKILSVGTFLVEHLLNTCNDLGIQILYNTKVDQILMEDGAAVGLHATGQEGNSVTVHAASVVMATGGFGSNPEMIVKYRPDLEGYVSTNAPSITGDAIPLLEEIGADFVDLEQIQIHPTVYQEDGSLITESLRGDGAILLNKDGVRFCNEILTRDVVSAHINEQPDSYAWLVVDSKMSEGSTVIQKYIDRGMMIECADTAALAELIGVDESVIAETLEKWQAAVAAQKDEEFERENYDALLTDLSNPPYYAVKISPGIHHCMGGVKINTNAEVISTEGEPIPGLFAAGEVTGGVHGGNRLGGNAVADFVVFGRIAGQNAAEYTAQAEEKEAA